MKTEILNDDSHEKIPGLNEESQAYLSVTAALGEISLPVDDMKIELDFAS